MSGGMYLKIDLTAEDPTAFKEVIEVPARPC